MQVPSLGREVPLEKEMATHSSTLTWEIPGTEEPGGLPLHGVTKESDTTEQIKKATTIKDVHNLKPVILVL